MHKVITANLLRTGEVVYLGAGGSWLQSLQDAVVVPGSDAAAFESLKSQAFAGLAGNVVTAVYALEVRSDGESIAPTSVREVIRAAHSPTV